MDVTLQWDANSEPDLEGYRIYYDTDSGEPYGGTDASCPGGDPCPSPITVPIGDLGDPDNPEYTLAGLDDNEVYFLVATAYDTEGLESGYSNEVNTPSITSPEPTLTPVASREGEEGGGCFIATATFGSR